VTEFFRPMLESTLARQVVHVHGPTSTMLIGGGTMSGNTYSNYGQVGAMGENPHAHDNTFQQVQHGVDLDKVRRLLTDMHERGAELRASLDAQRMTVLEGEVTRLRAELATPAPRPDVISGGLRSLRTVLEGAAGNVVASGWLQVLQGLG
jgi:hypothetical protein